MTDSLSLETLINEKIKVDFSSDDDVSEYHEETKTSAPQVSKTNSQPVLPLVNQGNPELFENLDTSPMNHEDTSHSITACKVRPNQLYDSPRPLKTAARIQFRLAEASDYDKGFPGILSQLTSLGPVTRKEYEDRLHELSLLNSQGRFLFWIIIGEDVESQKIAACTTLLIEPKFIHRCGSVAHVEDVVVDLDYRKLSIGQKALDIAINIAKEQGCYKIILDCNRENVPFYQAVGFSENSVHMALYLE